MSRDEALRFLQEGTRTGKLATTRADGRPHLVPIWFVIENDELLFTTHDDSVKTRNLRRDPRASLVVDLEDPPYAYVMVEGTVTFDDDRNQLLRIATATGGRYMGDDRAEEFGKRNAVPGETLARLSVDRVVARDDIAG